MILLNNCDCSNNRNSTHIVSFPNQGNFALCLIRRKIIFLLLSEVQFNFYDTSSVGILHSVEYVFF